MRWMAFALTLVGLCGTSFAADRIAIQGDYIEARNADVFTGPCFSNSEIFIVGDRALLAWKVNEGSWDGVSLDGLSVVAAVRANRTFGEDQPASASSVVIVDEKANQTQRDALVAMAKHLSNGRLDQIVAIKPSFITMMVESGHATESQSHHGMPQAPLASIWAPGLAEIVTRPLSDLDHVCGNEVVAYQPLAEGVTALPAYTIGHKFKGEGLKTVWSDPNARSSFVGHFSY
jgi:Protein of unknown function (DUF1326)